MRHLLPLLLVLTSCASGLAPLPPEKCTPALQSQMRSRCALAIDLECEINPDTCPPKALCDEALATICPVER